MLPLFCSDPRFTNFRPARFGPGDKGGCAGGWWGAEPGIAAEVSNARRKSARATEFRFTVSALPIEGHLPLDWLRYLRNQRESSRPFWISPPRSAAMPRPASDPRMKGLYRRRSAALRMVRLGRGGLGLGMLDSTIRDA